MSGDNYKRLVAENFDRRADYGERDFHKALAERLVEVARPQPGEAVLDIATGTGLAAIPAARAVGAAGRVVGIDISTGMLERAAKSIETAGLRNVELAHADAERLAYPDASFDLILCCSSLPFLTDIPAALRLWQTFLKPGGRVAFTGVSDTSFVSGVILKVVAARHGIRLVFSDATGTPERCRSLLLDAGFVDPEIVIDRQGRYVSLEQVEKVWTRNPTHPLCLPLLDAGPDLMERMGAEFLAEARSRATDQGVWDERTNYFVVGRKP
jgi:ubiquinone/menaquinone biosynthesis C-methylase UbiE